MSPIGLLTVSPWHWRNRQGARQRLHKVSLVCLTELDFHFASVDQNRCKCRRCDGSEDDQNFEGVGFEQITERMAQAFAEADAERDRRIACGVLCERAELSALNWALEAIQRANVSSLSMILHNFGFEVRKLQKLVIHRNTKSHVKNSTLSEKHSLPIVRSFEIFF